MSDGTLRRLLLIKETLVPVCSTLGKPGQALVNIESGLRQRGDFPFAPNLVEVYGNRGQARNEFNVGLKRSVVKSLGADNAEPNEGRVIVEEFFNP